MLNPEILIERNKLKSQISTWRGAFFLTIILVVLAVFAGKFLNVKSGFGSINSPYIAKIYIDGMIVEDSERAEILKEISKDKMVKAVIMNVNSPGGTAVGGETLYQQIKQLNSKKPTVAVMGSMATSAAYLISLGTEKIYAHNGTITGSIGVVAEIPNLKKTADKLGVRFDYVKSSPLKASPNLFEAKNPEALEVIKDMMMDFYYYFVEVVAKERGIDRETTISLADGRIYSAKQAQQNKLIDEIGGQQEAYNWIVETAKLDKDIEVHDVELKKPKSPFEELTETISGKIDIKSLFGVDLENYGLIL